MFVFFLSSKSNQNVKRKKVLHNLYLRDTNQNVEEQF